MPRVAADQPGVSVAAAIREAGDQLTRSDTPRLDAELLMAHALGVSRPALLARLRGPLDGAAAVGFASLVERRRNGEPVAYIVGCVGFYGLELEIGPAALVPRPETELLVEWAVDRARGRRGPIVALDVGTGCGAIAVALAGAIPGLEVHASDISPAALSLAERNVAHHDLRERVTLHTADLLPESPRRFDLVVANLPYVAVGDPDLELDVARHEPPEALFGGSDGLCEIRRLLARLPDRLNDRADVGFEIGWRHGAAALAEARSCLPSGVVRCRTDLAAHDRLITIEDVRCAVS